ncbi:YbaB/EbfC family nucleoid-associated protein [Mycobacterium attenuatum]|uniref:YbaB/EbfC family nucleoid-associated protein n=1 Tax=Mycobacterium attenuatum TaxID=2341086 RepID=UPI000F01605D|nr:YbaB/EbfC family nucleoid-associated protein [Mycobacterium attenuatum]VBA47228.1 ESX-1 secretion-associated protein EspL [Mycobacterium attenuatum]
MSRANHPRVAQMVHQAHIVMSLLDEQVRRMSAESFTAAHHTGAVEVSLNGHRRMTGLYIDPGVMGLGAQELASMINETIAGASDYVAEWVGADVADLEDRVAEALAVLRALPPPG